MSYGDSHNSELLIPRCERELLAGSECEFVGLGMIDGIVRKGRRTVVP